MEMKQPDLASLVERVREGEEDAFRIFMEVLYPTVIRIVRSHLPVRQLEEDLAQEVFVRVFKRIDQYQARPGIPVTHWVCRVATTTCLDALRAERRRPELRWADLSEDQAEWLQYMVADDQEEAPHSDCDTGEFLEKMLAQLSVDDLGGLLIPRIDLSEGSESDVGTEPIAIGELWLRNLTLEKNGWGISSSQLNVVMVNTEEGRVRAPRCILAVSKTDDNKPVLMIYGKSEQPLLTLPLSKVQKHQAKPLDMVASDDGKVDLCINGQYQASFSVAELYL